jgi:type I site-specific restriction endonuclease
MTSRRPEAKARREIDDALEASGWAVQDYEEMNLSASGGVAVREFVMAQGHGFADYLLFIDGRPAGALEAKPVGHTLTGVEGQARKYSDGVSSSTEIRTTSLRRSSSNASASSALPRKRHRSRHA